MKENSSLNLVLVVDDDVILSEIVEDTLKMVAASPRTEDSALFNERRAEFQAIVADSHLSRGSKSGCEHAHHAREL